TCKTVIRWAEGAYWTSRACTWRSSDWISSRPPSSHTYWRRGDAWVDEGIHSDNDKPKPELEPAPAPAPNSVALVLVARNIYTCVGSCKSMSFCREEEEEEEFQWKGYGIKKNVKAEFPFGQARWSHSFNFSQRELCGERACGVKCEVKILCNRVALFRLFHLT
ncbi:hypothetical protein BT96DRAFT_942416, partial [Gymnopus androsaceus JB14]